MPQSRVGYLCLLLEFGPEQLMVLAEGLALMGPFVLFEMESIIYSEELSLTFSQDSCGSMVVIKSVVILCL